MDEAHSAYLKDNFDKSKAMYEEILANLNAKQVADILRAQAKLAQVFIKAQRYTEAITLLEQILQKNPKDVKILYQKVCNYNIFISGLLLVCVWKLSGLLAIVTRGIAMQTQ